MSTDRIWGAGTSSSTRRIGFREWYHCDKSVIADLFPSILRVWQEMIPILFAYSVTAGGGGGGACRTWFSPQEPPTAIFKSEKIYQFCI